MPMGSVIVRLVQLTFALGSEIKHNAVMASVGGKPTALARNQQQDEPLEGAIPSRVFNT